MILAVGLFTVGELGAELFTTRVAIITLFIGSVWWLYGYAVVRVTAFPLLLLYLMLPLPGFVHRNLTFPLQLIASSVSVDILNTLGFLAYREGNVIDMGFSQFQVVEACNGLRFILPLLCSGCDFCLLPADGMVEAIGAGDHYRSAGRGHQCGQDCRHRHPGPLFRCRGGPWFFSRFFRVGGLHGLFCPVHRCRLPAEPASRTNKAPGATGRTRGGTGTGQHEGAVAGHRGCPDHLRAYSDGRGGCWAMFPPWP